MSTTTNENVAMTFAKDANSKTASTLIVAKLGMIDRGASLDWLSQHPHEKEILLPPLTAMEVTNISDFEDDGKFNIRRIDVRLNCNMVSMTIEKLLGMRKQQVSELCEVVAKDLTKHDVAADIPSRTSTLDQLQSAIADEPAADFNNNARFSTTLGEVLDVMPKLGDEIQLLGDHGRDVYGLAAMGDNSGFVSTSWDSTARVWSLNDQLEYVSGQPTPLPAASLAMTTTGSTQIASGHFDGGVAIQDCGGSAADAVVLPQGPTTEGATSVAWNEAAKLLAVGTRDGRIMLWSISPGTEAKLVQTVGGNGAQPGHGSAGHSDCVRALLWVKKVGGDGQNLVSGSFDSSVIVWSCEDGLLQNVATVQHDCAVTSLADAGHACVCSGSEDGSVKMHNLENAKSVESEHVASLGAGVCSLAILSGPTADGTTLIACGLGDGTIALCEEGGGSVSTLRGHSGGVHALLWLGERGWLVSGGGDSTVRVWRVRSDTK